MGCLLKICRDCLLPKSLDKFHKDAVAKDGLRGQCRSCVSIYRHADRTANPEKKRAYDRRWRAASQGKSLNTYRKWCAANSERVRGYGSAWRVANREQAVAATRKWRAGHPEMVQMDRYRRRAREKKNEVFVITSEEIKRLLRRPCYLCNTSPSTTIDHIIPVVRNGRHSIGNILGACRKCNGSKHDKLLVEYRRYLMRAQASPSIRLTNKF